MVTALLDQNMSALSAAFKNIADSPEIQKDLVRAMDQLMQISPIQFGQMKDGTNYMRVGWPYPGKNLVTETTCSAVLVKPIQ